MSASDSKVFLIFLFVRILSVVIIQSFFVPDEYWQSLEVAHNLTFGYGYFTWEWRYGIRSYIYPMIFASFYKLIQFLNCDHYILLVYGPRVMQSILSAYSDFCFYKWTGSGKWAIFCIASSWFWFYTSSRTLINSFECALTTIALSKFPWLHRKKDDSDAFLWIIAILCSIRPTAIIVWILICMYHLILSRHELVFTIFQRYLPVGLSVIICSISIDTAAHGSFIITSYEFLKYNVIHDVGSWYGSEPWHWYLSSGFPAIVGIYFLPFVLATLVVIRNKFTHPNEIAMLLTIVFVIGIYSLLPHKEIRFLLPILPLVLYITSRFLAAWSRKASRVSIGMVGSILFLGNVFPALYCGFIHQRGTLDVMLPLREIAVNDPKGTDFLFLMPCHSTPYYSHIHVNVSARFLTCEPNFNKRKEKYVDEADKFYENPRKWLQINYPVNNTLPSHIITYDLLVPEISDFLKRYRKTHQIFHTNFPTSRVGQHIVIHERIKDKVDIYEDLNKTK